MMYLVIAAHGLIPVATPVPTDPFLCRVNKDFIYRRSSLFRALSGTHRHSKTFVEAIIRTPSQT